MTQLISRKNLRQQGGFTLAFAVVLCLIFSSLLTSVLYFLDFNSKESQRNIYLLQAKYLAEAANARALARLNVKTLPTVIKTPQQQEKEAQESKLENMDEWSDEDWQEWEYDESDWEADGKEQESDFNSLDLTQVPRYINFYLINPYYINIDKGDIISGAQYMALVMQQRMQIEKAQLAGVETKDQLLVEEVYFPLPEVNVQRIGRIPIPKGMHIKPGFKVTLSDHIPVTLRQNDIRQEYLNIFPGYGLESNRPILRAISPNYAEVGQLVDVRLDGDNLEQYKPMFNSLDIQIPERGPYDISVQVTDEVEPGRYKLRIGPQSAYFYVVPAYESRLTPQITDIIVPIEFHESHGQQFARMKTSDTLTNLTIEGSGFGDISNSPIIVPSSDALDVELTSYTDTKVTFNIKSRGAAPGLHSITLFNKGGQSNTWTFSIEAKDETSREDPGIGTYSTVITLLYVKSHSNIGFDTNSLTDNTSGRPDEAASGDSGRPSDQSTPGSTQGARFQRDFDLLKSDMETVWKVETIATVAGHSYKETQIIRRELPQVHAAITNNARVSFGTSDIQIKGMQEAIGTLFEASSSGDLEIFIEDPRPDANAFNLSGDKQPIAPSGSAIIEDLWFPTRDTSPSGRGFKADHIVAIVPAGGKSKFSDYAIIDSVGSKQLYLKEPGFEEPHYLNDEVIQFIPSLITPYGLSEQDSERFLYPINSHISVPGKTKLNYVLATPLEQLAEWTQGILTSTSVPQGVYEDYDGYIGLNIIQGTPSYDGGNALMGQGLLIIDTTQGGLNPSGGLVRIGGGTSRPSQFDGVIYVIGELELSGNVEITGAVVVHPLSPNSEMNISGHGHVAYSKNGITKSLLGLPFTRARSSRKLEKTKATESEFIKEHQDAIKFHEKEGGK